ncbi:hypothetical protein GCM10010404_80750 [Nonomuraea africana]
MLIFALAVVLFSAIYPAFGDRFPAFVPAAVGISAVLAAVIGAIRYTQQGYAVLGLGGTLA